MRRVIAPAFRPAMERPRHRARGAETEGPEGWLRAPGRGDKLLHLARVAESVDAVALNTTGLNPSLLVGYPYGRNSRPSRPHYVTHYMFRST